MSLGDLHPHPNQRRVSRCVLQHGWESCKFVVVFRKTRNRYSRSCSPRDRTSGNGRRWRERVSQFFPGFRYFFVASHSRVPKQRKFKIYQCLFNLNVAFESIGREIEALDDYQAVPVETLWRFAEELRAGLNHRILEALAERELKEWTLFGREIRARRRMAD